MICHCVERQTQRINCQSWDNRQWKKGWIWLLLWEKQHVLDYELLASFLHKLVSRSMGATDCSMAAPGPMLPLCQDLTSVDYHHNIHQLSSAQPPLPPPPPLFPASLCPFSTPSLIPPAGSSQNDTLSICLIISPLAASLRPSLGCTFFSKGGAKALQLDFLSAHLEGDTLWDTINPSLSSSEPRATGQKKKFKSIYLVSQRTECKRNINKTFLNKVYFLNQDLIQAFFWDHNNRKRLFWRVSEYVLTCACYWFNRRKAPWIWRASIFLDIISIQIFL